MNKLKIIFLLVTSLFALFNCRQQTEARSGNSQNEQTNQQSPVTELNAIICKELESSKVIMLGDAGHGHGYFMYKVTRLLNYWLDQVEKQQQGKLPTRLVLFLEESPKVVQQINHFIDTEDIASFLKYYIEYDSYALSNIFTIDYGIFLHQLRAISQRIALLNQKLNSSIELKIVGAEAEPPYDFNHPIDASFFKKKQIYFAFERDRLIAKNIQIFLKDHPDFKAIIFYGGLHLIREQVNKNQYINNPIIKDNLYSYFLAHYLDSLYTRNHVRVFFERPIFDFQYENILKIPTAMEAPDYYVSMKPYPNHALPMLFARSKTYFSALYAIVSRYQGKQSEAEKRTYQNLVLKWTNAICHTYLNEKITPNNDLRSTAEDVLAKSAALLNEYDTVESLKRSEAVLTLNIMPDDTYYQELVKMLSNIPAFKIDYQGTNTLENGRLTPDLKQKIGNFKEDISIYLAIHNLFIADQKESERIIEYLKSKLNFDYKTRMEWFEWWQGKYLPK